jgi:branched-chain amino acid aminotransferase
MDEAKVSLVHFEGALVPEAEARISLLSPAISRGPIAYETLRGYWQEDRGNLYLFRLRDHLVRLSGSMKILRFQELFEHGDLSGRIVDLIQANRFATDVHVRIFAYPLDEGGPGRTSARSGIFIAASARPATRVIGNARCQVSSWIRRGGDNHPARVKAVGPRLFARVALAQAEQDGYTDLIVQDERGCITEATSSNIFIVRHGVLLTPSLTQQILEGITRATVIKLAQEMGLPCYEREINRTELYVCEEAFLCSTGLEILPITSIDRIEIAGGFAGAITQKLQDRYRSLVVGKIQPEEGWLTPVY